MLEQNVKLLITIRSAVALHLIPEIRLPDVRLLKYVNHKNLKEIHVNHLLVDQILYVELLVIIHHVRVSQITSVHHQIVDRNVLLTPIVHQTWRVFLKNAEIPVKDRVDLTLNAEYRIIFQYVHVFLVLLEIHSHNAIKL